jgi:hypothetical protein
MKPQEIPANYIGFLSSIRIFSRIRIGRQAELTQLSAIPAKAGIYHKKMRKIPSGLPGAISQVG